MNRQKDPVNKIDEIKLFYNDIKYVTRSLTKDSEELFSCLAMHSLPDRRDPRGIEAFMKDEEKRLEEIRRAFQKLKQNAKKGRRRFHIREWNSFEELNSVLQELTGISEELEPAKLWFSRSNYDTIHDMIDEAQTKVEDSVKAHKRIFKVWSEDVLQAHNVRFTNEYVDMLNGTMKYFNTNFWKYRKHLKTLFIEEESLYSDEEIKLLKKNVTTMTENDNWLFFKQRRIKEVIGGNYIGKETDFYLIRKNYDMFYSWMLQQNEENTISYEEFPRYCAYLEELRMLDYKEYFHIIQECIPFMTEKMVYEFSFSQIEKQIEDYQYALKVIRNQYGISYLRDKKDHVGLEQWNKLIQRVIEKTNWLTEKKEQIEHYFGGTYTGVNTDWNKMKECITDSTEEINGILARRIKQYGFERIEEKQEVCAVESIQQAVELLLKGEHAVYIPELIKKSSKMLGQKRITAKFKKEVELYLKESLLDGYDIEGDFIIAKDEKNLQFRIANENEKREVEQISKREMEYGVLNVIRVEEEIPLDDLTKIFAKLLGYPRRTKNLGQSVESAVKQLKQDGRIVRNSGGWSLIET